MREVQPSFKDGFCHRVRAGEECADTPEFPLVKLFVTNTRTAQAYSIIRCLRPYADKIVAEMYGRSWLAARISPAANSRLVDARYRVPYPTRDWQAGRIQRENTEAEERYLQRVLEICEREQIDTLFPSFDPHVYIFSKNKARLAERGLFTPVPDYDVLLQSLDKYRTVEAARVSGFPHPRTWLADSPAAAQSALRESAPPWVVRPRFSAGSVGLQVVSDPAELEPAVQRSAARYGTPMIQEYVPGMQRQNFYVLADRASEVKFLFCPRILRTNQRVYRNACAAAEGAAEHALVPAIKKLVKHLGWTGTLTLQAKIDARTGQPLLMEINPRVGTHLWYRIAAGINEPQLCLQIARGEPLETLTPRTGMLLLEPLEDAIALGFEVIDLALYRLRVNVLRRKSIDAASFPPSLLELFRSYARNYFTRQPKAFSPLTTCLRDDPLVSLLWGYTIFRSWTFALPRLGR